MQVAAYSKRAKKPAVSAAARLTNANAAALLVASPRRKHMEQAVTTPNASTGIIKAASPAAGFVGASGSKPEDQVTQLLALYTKCLGVVQGK
jgi:hypothetical protein